MSAPVNKRPNSYIVKGVLNGEKVAYGKSTMAAMTEYSVHQIEIMIGKGIEGQALLNAVFSKQLEINDIRRRFFTQFSPRIDDALWSSGNHIWCR